MPIEQIKRVLTEDMLEHDVTMKKAIELITGTATEAKEQKLSNRGHEIRDCDMFVVTVPYFLLSVKIYKDIGQSILC